MANQFPPGHPLVSSYAQAGQGAPPVLPGLPPAIPTTNDPAWQPPGEKLIDPRAQARVIHREIPITTVNTSWDPGAIRGAIQQLVIGLFDQPSQLIDSIVGDSRVQATMASRTGGLLGKAMRFRPVDDSSEAQDCLNAWMGAWPHIGAESVLSELLQWSTHLGFGMAQLLWDTSDEIWVPHMKIWHPRYTYYHWIYRQYIAVTLDGQTPVTAGDAHWVLHAPHGEYRGWMRGAVRAVAPWWLARNYALRDWARWSERHGLPIIKAKTPAAGDPTLINQFRTDLANLGQETIVQCPVGVDEQNSYDMDLIEASDGAWEGFQKLIDQCDIEITLALLSQNLTTEVKEGSYAAARVHGDVRQTLLEADARALAKTLREQVGRPFAAVNFGNPDIAPIIEWDLEPAEDKKELASCMQSFAIAVVDLRKAGFQINNLEDLARNFGLKLKLGDIEMVDPLISGGTPGAGIGGP